MNKYLPYLLAGGGIVALLALSRKNDEGSSDGDEGSSTDTELGFGESAGARRVFELYGEGLVAYLNQCLEDGEIPDPTESLAQRALAVSATAQCATDYAQSKITTPLSATDEQILLDATAQMAALWLDLVIDRGSVDTDNRSVLETAIDIAVWGPIVGQL